MGVGRVESGDELRDERGLLDPSALGRISAPFGRPGQVACFAGA